MKITLENIAEYIMFGIIKNNDELQERIKGQWEFRKNKDVSDLNNAVRKGVRLGMGKTEDEVSCIALYLKSVLKQVKSQ